MNSLALNIATQLLEPVRYRPSPHCDARPEAADIDLVVIHGISLPPGEFGGEAVEHFFCGTLDMSSHPDFSPIAHLKVSAHLFIKRDGEIIQFVPFHQRAWHAGESLFAGRTRCNDFSIGIELEGTDTTPYQPIQYTQLTQVLRLLMQHYTGITPERIVGHEEIAPGRKTDPGPAFDWHYLKGSIT